MIRLERLRINLPGFSLQDVDLSVDQGDFFALLGPTGAGKTLILEAIGGLKKIHGGRIFINGREATDTPPEKRGVGIVYQDTALFPHLTVRQNITYGLRYASLAAAEARHNFQRLVDLLDIGHLQSRGVHHLSGGEKQRVALARALVVNPAVLLLDEPLSALDPNFRGEIRKALKSLHQELGLTFLMVTHDFADALFLAGRAALISRGCLEQSGDIDDIFQHPATPFAAEFVGMKNVFPAAFGHNSAMVEDLQLDLARPASASCGFLAIRPEDVLVTENNQRPDQTNLFSGEITQITYNGFAYEVSIKVGRVELLSLLGKWTLLDLDLAPGAPVMVRLEPRCLHAF